MEILIDEMAVLEIHLCGAMSSKPQQARVCLFRVQGKAG